MDFIEDDREDRTNIIMCLLGENGEEVKEAAPVIIKTAAPLIGDPYACEIYATITRPKSTLKACAAYRREKSMPLGTAACESTTQAALPSLKAGRLTYVGGHTSI